MQTVIHEAVLIECQKPNTGQIPGRGQLEIYKSGEAQRSRSETRVDKV